ncbi:MAG: hypothetical protein JKY52_16310 [Flavobacteriales bacterium]|nr:hypothetical protein [Flavobacteriales bacterium]
MGLNLRERLNLAIYDSKDKVLQILWRISLAVSIIALGTLLYIHGFDIDNQTEQGMLLIIKVCFSFYVLRYFTRLMFAFDITSFLKNTWFEGILVGFLLTEGISDILFKKLITQRVLESLGYLGSIEIDSIFIQSLLFMLVIMEIGKSSELFPRIKVHPSYLFLLSFIIIIFFGTLMLMLPEATVQEGSMSLIDALFTATSAVSVTGLIVVDTATFYSPKGHLIIMALMQIGALNVIAFGVFFTLFSKFKISMIQHQVTEDFFGGHESHFTAQGMLRKIILWSFVIEVIGAVLIYYTWTNEAGFTSYSEKVFSSIFHSISAFNNGGFSLFSNGFTNEAVHLNYGLHTVIIGLMFIGTLGFIPLFDLFNYSKLKDRWQYPWKQISFSSKISIYFSLGLITLGMVAFFFLEYNNTLQGKSFLESIVTSLFQAITPRNIGFNTVDLKDCTIPMLVIFMFLMFVGAGSASSGGGIRTSSFALLYASAIATITGKRDAELFKRSIPHDLIFKAISVCFFFLLGTSLTCLLLTITESHILAMPNRDFMDVLFESVSAFTTTGLSMGITPELSDAGKVIEILAMYIGRVGTLSVAYIFGRKVISTSYKYAEGNTLVG